jgi:hypothetical protein
MKPAFKNLVIAALLFSTAGILSCGEIKSADIIAEGIKIDSDISNFKNDLSRLNNPKGMLPSTMNVGVGIKGIIRKTPNAFREYFVFDENTVLAILSISPFYYLTIHSSEAAIKFSDEYTQFQKNVYLDSSAKAVNSEFKFIKAGTNDIAIAFTPSELTFSDTTGQIIIKNNGGSTFQPYNLLENASWSTSYIPNFEESYLYDTISAKRAESKTIVLYSDKSDFFPPIHSVPPKTLNFPFMYIKGATATDDYFILFSNPIGDSQSTSGSKYLADENGFAIFIKASSNLTILPFLKSCGFNFNIIPPIAKALKVEQTDTTEITLQWTPESTVSLSRAKVTDPVDYDSAAWEPLESDYYGSSYVDNNIDLGYIYYYRLVDPESGNTLVEKSIAMPKDPVEGELIFTELAYLGSLQNEATSATLTTRHAEDRWIEIKNDSQYVLSLKTLAVYNSGTLICGPNGSGSTAPIDMIVYPGKYFIIANTIKYMFSEMVISDIAIRRISPVDPLNGIITMSFNGSLSASTIGLSDDAGDSTNDENGNTVYKSKVLLADKITWKNCQTDFIKINPLSSYITKNCCTPGTAGHGDLDEY